jgi:conjugal transfer pilus assembly protein TraF
MQFYGIIVLLLLNINEGFCNASFYKEKARGWHWYETKKDETSDETPKKSPTQMVNEIRNDTETKLHKALIEPTESNIIEYIKAQEKVIYKNPSLDRTLRITEESSFHEC